MLFLPKGPMPGDVIDPAKMSRDYVEADRVASQTTQWQWSAQSINNPQWLERGSHVSVESASVQADIGITITAPPNLSGTNQFAVPYKTGYDEISDVAVTYTTKYPELVMMTFSFQYIRRFIITSGTPASYELRMDDSTHNVVRFSVRLKVDGVLQPGGGIYKHQVDGNVRGTGYAHKSLASCVTVVTMLPAGSHTIVPVVGLTDCTEVDSLDTFNKHQSPDYGPTEGVVVGNREMIVVRFGRGQWMGG